MAPNDKGGPAPAGKDKPDTDKDKTASIQIDGEPYKVTRGDHVVAELIGLTGADPANTDLVQVKGREQSRLRDDQTVSVASGDKFVTVSTEPTPVA